MLALEVAQDGDLELPQHRGQGAEPSALTITPALVNAGIFLGEFDAPVAPVTKPCIPIEICFIKAIYPFYPEKYFM